jgi:nicotinamidase-related amidase
MKAKPVDNTPSQNVLPRSPELMNREDSALFVVDAQERLLEIIPDSARIVWNLRRLVDAAKTLGVPVSGAEQYPQRLGPTAAALKERIGPLPHKRCFSAGVCGDVFEQWNNEGRSRVLVCGIETHVCVMQTAFDVAAAGFEVHVAVDAVGARYAVDHETALRRMGFAGVILSTTETAMFEWCRTAEAAEFKAISALAKEKSP